MKPIHKALREDSQNILGASESQGGDCSLLAGFEWGGGGGGGYIFHGLLRGVLLFLNVIMHSITGLKSFENYITRHTRH